MDTSFNMSSWPSPYLKKDTDTDQAMASDTDSDTHMSDNLRHDIGRGHGLRHRNHTFEHGLRLVKNFNFGHGHEVFGTLNTDSDMDS